MKNAQFLLFVLLLLSAPITLSGQIQRNSLYPGLCLKFLRSGGENALGRKVQVLYSASNRLTVGINFEVFSSGTGEDLEASIALQPCIRYYFINRERIQCLVQGHIGVFKFITFDGAYGPCFGVAAGPRFSITKRLGVETHFVWDSGLNARAFGLSVGVDYIICCKKQLRSDGFETHRYGAL